MNARRELRRRRRRRRRIITLGVVLAGVSVATLVVELGPLSSNLRGDRMTIARFSGATASASTRASIVAFALREVGYRTDPSSTYCNQFSAYWFSGRSDCGNANRDEQWCADFAAWTWREAGVPLVYKFVNGDLNSSSASFYEWGLRHQTWHRVGSGYVPQPGDVAVYGLNEGALVAQHVAVVVGFTPGDRGPNAVNGDGDHTGFSRVEFESNEYNADRGTTSSAPLSGYVAPNT